MDLVLRNFIVAKRELTENKLELGKTKVEFAMTKNDLTEVKEEILSLKTKFDERETELTQTKTEFAQMKANLEKSSTELAQTRTDFMETKTELAKMKTELGMTKTELLEMKKELESMKSDLKGTVYQIKEVSKKLEERFDERLTRTERVLNIQLRGCKSQGERLSEDVKNLQSLSKTRSEMLDDTKSELDQIRSQMMKWSKTLTEVSGEGEALFTLRGSAQDTQQLSVKVSGEDNLALTNTVQDTKATSLEPSSGDRSEAIFESLFHMPEKSLFVSSYNDRMYRILHIMVENKIYFMSDYHEVFFKIVLNDNRRFQISHTRTFDSLTGKTLFSVLNSVLPVRESNVLVCDI